MVESLSQALVVVVLAPAWVWVLFGFSAVLHAVTCVIRLVRRGHGR